MKGQPAKAKLKPDATYMFCRARKVSLASQGQVKTESATLESQGIKKPVEPGGVICASSVIWQRKRTGLFDFALGLKDKLKSDHKPLEFIISPSRDSSNHISERTCSWSISLIALEYDVVHHEGRGNSICKCHEPSPFSNQRTR